MFLDLIEEIAKEVPIPFIVGGGIRTIEDIEKIFSIGGDKVSINSAALVNPALIEEAAEKFGSERIILSMDVKKTAPGKWTVFAKGGKEDTGMDAIEWAIKGKQLGAGELVVNSIDEDGVKDGYDIDLYKALADCCRPSDCSKWRRRQARTFRRSIDGREGECRPCSLGIPF